MFGILLKLVLVETLFVQLSTVSKSEMHISKAWGKDHEHGFPPIETLAGFPINSPKAKNILIVNYLFS